MTAPPPAPEPLESTDWSPPDHWTRYRVIDAHTAGEPLRVITGGYPGLDGGTILEMRRDARDRHDAARRALMLEPRGHADMYGCVLTRPVTDDGDVGVLFLHNEGYSTMCGHGIIGLVKVGLDCGLLQLRPGQDVLRIDSPAGRVTARPTLTAGGVTDVSFENVPSFLLERGCTVEVTGLGSVTYDLAYGGAFYAYVEAGSVGLEVEPSQVERLIAVGMDIKRAVMASHPFAHPEGDADLNFLYGVIFTQPGTDGAHLRNVCIFADGEVDRSPTGTGVSGRAAIEHASGRMAVGEELVIESLIGTRFKVRVARETRAGAHEAIVPEVTGRAFITGINELLIEPGDPLAGGVLLRGGSAVQLPPAAEGTASARADSAPHPSQ